MRKRFLAAMLFMLVAATTSYGTTLTVCASGCDHTTIQAADNAASASDTISIGAGTYYENLAVTTQQVFIGAGEGLTNLYGATLYNTTDCYHNGDVYSVKHTTGANPTGVWVDDTWYAMSADSATMAATDELVWASTDGTDDTDSLYIHFAAGFSTAYAPLNAIYAVYVAGDGVQFHDMTFGYSSGETLYQDGTTTKTTFNDCTFNHIGGSGYLYIAADDTVYATDCIFADAQRVASYTLSILGSIYATGSTFGSNMATATAGVYLSTAGPGSFTSCTFTSAAGLAAIYTAGGDCDITVATSTFTIPTTCYGIIAHTNSTGDITVTGSTFNGTDNAKPIFTAANASAADVTITGNTFAHTASASDVFHSSAEAIRLSGNYTGGQVGNNTFTGTWGKAIRTDEFTTGDIYDNTWAVVKDTTTHGIIVGGEYADDPGYFSHNVNVYGNYLKNQEWGLLFEYGADSSHAFNNYIEDATVGIYLLHECNHDTLFNNEIVSCTSGISIPKEVTDGTIVWAAEDSCHAIHGAYNTFIDCTKDTTCYYNALETYTNTLISDYDTGDRYWEYYWGGGDFSGKAAAKITTSYNWLTRGYTQGTTWPVIGAAFARLEDADSLVTIYGDNWAEEDIVVYPVHGGHREKNALRQYEIDRYIETGSDTLYIVPDQIEAIRTYR